MNGLRSSLRAAAIWLLQASWVVRRPWAQRVLRRRVARLRRHGGRVRVVIGAGPTAYSGWLATDLPVLDALKEGDWSRIFRPGDVDRVLAEHVIEHWTERELRQFLRAVRPYLSRVGRIRVAVPDGLHPDSSYIDEVKPGGTGLGADDHKVLHTFPSMAAILSDEGYGAEPLEYFDDGGRFHRLAWSAEDGFVMRSADHDDRNGVKPLSYTSLILDAFPR
jgi:predicted SAM-dependent methyltransferase